MWLFKRHEKLCHIVKWIVKSACAITCRKCTLLMLLGAEDQHLNMEHDKCDILED